MITAICPGSYDPVTMGHVDVISRAASIFDRVVVGVVASPRHKTPLFSLDDAPGTLFQVLRHFAERGINLKKIQSRPVRGLKKLKANRMNTAELTITRPHRP